MSARKVTSTMKFMKFLDDQIEKLFQWLWRHRKMLGAAVAVLLAAWALSGGETERAPEESGVAVQAERVADHLVNRVWIDRIPKNPEQRFHLYFFLKSHPHGVHITFHNLAWRVQEFFTYKLKEGKLGFHFQSPDIKVSTPIHVKKLSGEKHFDMLLEIDRDPQAKGTAWSYRRLKEGTTLAGLPDAAGLEKLLETLESP